MSYRVYVAGPFSSDPERCTLEALEYAHYLRELGHFPFVPHAMFKAWDAVHPRSYHDWLEQCLVWVEQCDALVRIPGHSPGADAEMEHAAKYGISVFEGLPAFIRWAHGRDL